MTRLRRLTLLLIAIVATFGVASATPLQQEAREFAAEVAAVQTDVLILDETGRPVVGLTRDDFDIYEDGVKQQIDSVDLIEAMPAAGASNVAQRRFTLSPRTGPTRFALRLRMC